MQSPLAALFYTNIIRAVVFIGHLTKLNWLYTNWGIFLPAHYTPIFTPQTVGGFINNILAHHA